MNKSFYNENSNIISHNLRKYRNARNLSQEELAAQMQLLGVDISQPLISKIERNERFVKDYELVCFCKIFEIPPEQLLSDFYNDAVK